MVRLASSRLRWSTCHLERDGAAAADCRIVGSRRIIGATAAALGLPIRLVAAGPAVYPEVHEDIADAVLFLVSNGFTTGAIVDVDGGAR